MYITPLQAQQNHSLYTAAPNDWRAEAFPFPLSFAPEIKYRGIEELRFAPGMFVASSETYFTYTFIWWLEGRNSIDARVLERDLMIYFQGLYRAVSKKADKDVSSFKIEVKRDSIESVRSKDVESYKGRVEWIDPFVTEEQVRLNFKATRWYCAELQRTAVFFRLSPRPFEHANWQTMQTIKAGQCDMHSQ